VKIGKKIVLSFLIGGLATFIICLYAQIPSNGPRTSTIIFQVPFMLIAEASGKIIGNLMSECLFYGLQILFYTTLAFLVFSIFQKATSKK
jgi:hypothetical protein